MIETIEIANRDQWLALRKKDVTASVAGAFVGDADAYQTMFEVWADKTGKLKETPQTGKMKRGNKIEPLVIEELAEKHPDWKLTRPGVYLRDPEKRIGCTPDCYAQTPDGKKINVQIKTTDSMIFRQKWRDKSTGMIELPLWIALQCMIETDLSLADSGMVALLVVDTWELYEIDVPRHAGAMRAFQEAVADFWRITDSGEPMPPNYGRDRETLKRVYDEGGQPPIVLTGDNAFGAALQNLDNAKATIKAAEAIKDEAEAVIFSKLGNHDTATYYDRVITWKLQHRKESFVKASSFRVLRAPAPK